MRLWLSRNSRVPLREQLATQLLLGVFSEDLKPGQKLQSTRALALRMRIHPNTVSAAYRDLVRRGWLEFRKGSGIYVRKERPNTCIGMDLELDHIISSFFRTSREKGFSLADVQARLKQWLDLQPPDHFLIIESDEELRRILVAEIHKATGFPVRGTGVDDSTRDQIVAGSAPVFMLNKESNIRGLLPPQVSTIVLHTRSVPSSLSERNPISADTLIAVASRWPEFLRWARAVLVASGVSIDALHFCDARKSGWKRGLRGSTVVVTDVLTAESIPQGCRLHIFNLIADSSLDELNRFIDCLNATS